MPQNANYGSGESFDTHQYAYQILLGEIPACLEVRQACQRHLDDLKRDDIWFDEEAASKFFRYCTRFKHYKGPKKGQPIELDLWQKFIFGCLYGWKLVIDDEKTNQWKYKSAYIEVPKKNGKSTVCGAVASYDAFVMEDSGAEVYCLATKEDQAKIVWNDCNVFIENSDFNHMFDKVGKSIYVANTSRSSFIRPLGKDSKSNDGLNPFSAIVDELHAHPTREILDIIEDGFVARENYHLIIITTAGNDQHGVCYQERTHSKQILSGMIEDDSKFAIIYTVDKEDRKNWKDESVWFKANPGLGLGKSVEAMRVQINKAATLPSKRNTVLTKQLNIWTSVAEIWIQPEFWEKCRSKKTIKDIIGKACYGGMDLARVSDMSATPFLFPPQAGLDKWVIYMNYFIPQENIEERVRNDRVPYDVWRDEGYLEVTGGNTTDFGYIKDSILQRAKMFNIINMGYDQHFGGDIVSGLENHNLEMVDISSTFPSMNIVCSEFERMIMAGEIEYIANPILDWNVENTVILKNPEGLIRPDKSNRKKRIDGLIACLYALGGKMFGKNDKKYSPYEGRGLRSV